jgi:hypothetical protein
MRLRRSLSAAAFAVVLGFSAAAAAQEPKPTLGLMGTIPVYWGEAEGLSDLIGDPAAPHWARAQLEAGYDLRPLDTLGEGDLAGLDYLFLAQPRALTPAENVALDAWVRRGGRLLLLADPMLTGHSRFAIGDRRRPQDVILLSPILTHWGLLLEFDVERAAGDETVVVAGGVAIPVNRPGRFAAIGEAGACSVTADGLLAACRLGEGTATILADAAVLDLEREDGAAALAWLVRSGFGETAGSAGGGESARR